MHILVEFKEIGDVKVHLAAPILNDKGKHVAVFSVVNFHVIALQSIVEIDDSHVMTKRVKSHPCTDRKGAAADRGTTLNSDVIGSAVETKRIRARQSAWQYE